MKYIKSILAIIIGTFAMLLLLAEIEAQVVVFCLIKLASIATIAFCIKVLAGSSIINLDEE